LPTGAAFVSAIPPATLGATEIAKANAVIPIKRALI